MTIIDKKRLLRVSLYTPEEVSTTKYDYLEMQFLFYFLISHYYLLHHQPGYLIQFPNRLTLVPTIL